MARQLRSGLWLFLAFLSASPLAAQRYTGSYTTTDAEGTPATLVLREMGGGAVSGSFTRGRVAYRVDARLVDDLVSGSMRGTGGDLYFEADRTASELWLTLWGTNAMGEPDEEDFVELAFALGGPSAPGGGVPPRAGVPPGPGTGTNPGSTGNPLASGNPLSGSISDPYSGYFTDGNVALELWGGGGQYEGQIVVGGERYPVRASGGAGGISGTLESADGSYPVSGQLQGGVLVLVSGGVQYYLYRDALGRPLPQYGPGYGTDPTSGAGARPGAVGVPARPGPGVRPGFTEQHIMAREWIVFLAGQSVRRLIADTGRGPTDPGDRIDVSLCSNRSFTTRPGNRASRVPSRAPLPSEGRWSVVSDGDIALLLLDFRDGRRLEFRMHFADRLPYANGSRIDVAPSESCR